MNTPRRSSNHHAVAHASNPFSLIRRALLKALRCAAVATPAFAAPGDLDTTFNGTGKVTTAIGSGNDRAFGMTVQNDGKVVVVGSSSNHFAVVRYNPDGSLDTTFGMNQNGKVTTNFGGHADIAYCVAVQPDGKIVAGGEYDPQSQVGYFALARYNADGTLDASFGSGGKKTTSLRGGQRYDSQPRRAERWQNHRDGELIFRVRD